MVLQSAEELAVVASKWRRLVIVACLLAMAGAAALAPHPASSSSDTSSSSAQLEEAAIRFTIDAPMACRRPPKYTRRGEASALECGTILSQPPAETARRRSLNGKVRTDVCCFYNGPKHETEGRRAGGEREIRGFKFSK